jgi:hypothetical protein
VELVVRNQQSDALTLERTVSSCPCIGVSGLPVRLRPNEARGLKVAFDPAEAPEFRGGLSVELDGYLADARIAFRTRVEFDVVTRDEGSHD